MSLSRLTQGLPYSAVLALLGWLMLSQGQPTVDVPPQASALTRAESGVCADSSQDGVRNGTRNTADDLRVMPAVPDTSADLSPCPAESEAERR